MYILEYRQPLSKTLPSFCSFLSLPSHDVVVIMNLSRGDSSDSGLAGSSVSSRSDETDLTSPTDSPSPDGPSAFAPPLDDRHNKRASAFELQDREHLPPLDTRSGLDGNNATENVDHGQSPSGSLPTQGLAHDHSTSSSRTLALFGLWGEKWRKWLIFHVVVAIAFNGLALALAVYSSFWGDSAVKRQLSKMQKVLGSKVEDIGGCTDAAREELLALAKWNSFNNWIISCAQYAVSVCRFSLCTDPTVETPLSYPLNGL